MLRTFDPNLIKQLNEAYINKINLDSLEGVTINHEPFTHCIINDVITDHEFLDKLVKEMKTGLKYKKKNNDLYKFHQTLDLGKNKQEHMKKFRDEILYGKLLELLKNMTNIDLSSAKIDVTSSKYEHTDYLLCHDDDIHDESGFGRRIAFVFYLVPPDWNSDGSDGGNLDLFRVDDNLNPVEICKSVVPVRNSLVCFEVSDRSFHQVSEVLSKSKTRLSINGWFHGPINHRPTPPPHSLPQPISFKTIEPDRFFEWVVEKYLKPRFQSEIQLVFSKTSEVKLDKIFNSQKYDQVNEALKSAEISWKSQGPANKRCYEIAELESLPKIVQELIEILTSDCMGLCLSNMTALRLHPSMPKSRETDDSTDEDDDFEDEQDQEASENEDDSFDEEDGPTNDHQDAKNQELKRKLDDDSKPCSSKSVINQNKKIKNEEEETHTDDDDYLPIKTTKLGSGNEKEEENFTGKCYFEVRRWKKGSYTLITDDNEEIRTKALDMMMFFGCKNWSRDCGGNVSYIARDEDDELLTVEPEENCASLVYRDEETLKFTKCVNSNIDEVQNGCFYEISLVYYE